MPADNSIPSWIKGRSLEEIVARWAEAKGYRYARNARLHGKSGSTHEVDLLLETSEGRIVVEVKNTAGKVDKDVVMKAAFVASDIGARGAIVVSSSGFTQSASRIARALGVELLTLEDIINYIEIAGMPGDAVFLEPLHGAEQAARIAERAFAERLLFIRKERAVSAECTYHPFYHFRARIPIKERRTVRYRDISIAASAVTGLPLSHESGALIHSCAPIAHLPPDIIEEYRELAGRTVERKEYTRTRGEWRWRRLTTTLRSLGLLEEVSQKPVVLKVKNILPSIEALERAADLMLTTGKRIPAGGCKLEEPRVSPGSISSFIESLLGATASSFIPVYAPVYSVKLARSDGSYRIVKLAGWLKRPVQVIDEY